VATIGFPLCPKASVRLQVAERKQFPRVTTVLFTRWGTVLSNAKINNGNIAFKIAAKPLHIGTWLLLTAYIKSPSPYHGLCRSNKLLYKRCAKSMGRPKFRPPTAPTFSTDFNETQNQERYPGYDPTCKIWLMWDNGKGVCVGRAFSVTFLCSIFFLFLLTPTGHTRRPITTIYGSKRVFPRKVGPFGGLDDKKVTFGVKTPQNMILGD